MFVLARALAVATLNVQHVESLKRVIAQITRIRAVRGGPAAG